MNVSPQQEKRIYTVTGITRDIRTLLENSFPQIWVEGEISNLVAHSSGHCYFSIKDAESVLACVMFKQSAYRLKFKLEDGMSVVCSGKISLYNKRGQYQLYVDGIEPKGVGSLQLAFTQLKERLLKEGIFDKAHKKPLPEFPRHIGIVTSPTGAAIRDMLHVIQRRFPNMRITLFPAKVQGEGAGAEVKEGIEALNILGNVDVIIIGRGGGSLEDLWAFNEEIVVRAIHASSIPIISAVGHEVDYTISDFVADLRAPTPSAAAELVVQRKEDIVQLIDSNVQRLKAALNNRAQILEKHLDGLMNRYAFRQPHFLIEQNQQRVDDNIRSLQQSLEHLLTIKRQMRENLIGRLRALNPTAILERGYSITMTHPDGKIIRDNSALKKGQAIKTKLAKGEITSEVI